MKEITIIFIAEVLTGLTYFFLFVYLVYRAYYVCLKYQVNKNAKQQSQELLKSPSE